MFWDSKRKTSLFPGRMEQWLWGRLWRSLWCSQLSLHPFQRRCTHGVQCGPPCGSLGPEVAKGCVQSHRQRGGQLVSRNWGEKESSSMTLWVRLSLQQLELHLTNFIGLSACLLPVCFSSCLNLGIEDDTVVAWPAVSGSEPLYVTSHGRGHICLERLSWRSELLPHNLQSICMCFFFFGWNLSFAFSVVWLGQPLRMLLQWPQVSVCWQTRAKMNQSSRRRTSEEIWKICRGLQMPWWNSMVLVMWFGSEFTDNSADWEMQKQKWDGWNWSSFSPAWPSGFLDFG